MRKAKFSIALVLNLVILGAVVFGILNQYLQVFPTPMGANLLQQVRFEYIAAGFLGISAFTSLIGCILALAGKQFPDICAAFKLTTTAIASTFLVLAFTPLVSTTGFGWVFELYGPLWVVFIAPIASFITIAFLETEPELKFRKTIWSIVIPIVYLGAIIPVVFATEFQSPYATFNKESDLTKVIILGVVCVMAAFLMAVILFFIRFGFGKIGSGSKKEAAKKEAASEEIAQMRYEDQQRAPAEEPQPEEPKAEEKKEEPKPAKKEKAKPAPEKKEEPVKEEPKEEPKPEESKPEEKKEEPKPVEEKKPAPKAKKAPAKKAEEPKPEEKPAPEKKEEPEAEEKEEPASEGGANLYNDKARVYHISKQSDTLKWQVKLATGQKAIKLFPTQKEAIDYAKSLVKTQGGSIRVHSLKGKMRKE